MSGEVDDNPVWRDGDLQIVFAVTLTAVMGVSSITPAFPQIAEYFDISPDRTGMLITVYYIPGVLLSPVLGFLADQWGRKIILGPSLLIFGLAGAACGLADSYSMLLVLRAGQGVGAAALGALNLTVIGDLFDGERRAEAMGYNASVLSVGTAAYPAIGGALAIFGWYAPFLLPLIGIPTGWLVLTRLDNPEPDGDVELGKYLRDFGTILADRRVVAIFFLWMVTFVVLFGPYLTYFPILMDSTFGSPSFVIGVVMSSVSVASGVMAAYVGALTRRFSQFAILVAAFVLYAITFAAIPFVENLWTILIPSLTYGIAQGLNIPTLQTMLAGFAPMEQRGAFMSFSGMVNRIGQAAGPVVGAALFGPWGLEGVYLGAAGLSLTSVPLIYVLTGDN